MATVAASAASSAGGSPAPASGNQKSPKYAPASGDGDGGDVEYITTLNPNDVLCGRGSGPNDHSGNIKFRLLVNERKPEYLSTNNRQVKARIAREIMEHVLRLSPPGRFLRKVDAASAKARGYRGDVWCCVDEETALEKAKQALRQNRGKDPVFGKGAAAAGSDDGSTGVAPRSPQVTSSGGSTASEPSYGAGGGAYHSQPSVPAIPEEAGLSRYGTPPYEEAVHAHQRQAAAGGMAPVDGVSGPYGVHSSPGYGPSPHPVLSAQQVTPNRYPRHIPVTHRSPSGTPPSRTVTADGRSYGHVPPPAQHGGHPQFHPGQQQQHHQQHLSQQQHHPMDPPNPRTHPHQRAVMGGMEQAQPRIVSTGNHLPNATAGYPMNFTAHMQGQNIGSTRSDLSAVSSNASTVPIGNKIMGSSDATLTSTSGHSTTSTGSSMMMPPPPNPNGKIDKDFSKISSKINDLAQDFTKLKAQAGTDDANGGGDNNGGEGGPDSINDDSMASSLASIGTIDPIPLSRVGKPPSTPDSLGNMSSSTFSFVKSLGQDGQDSMTGGGGGGGGGSVGMTSLNRGDSAGSASRRYGAHMRHNEGPPLTILNRGGSAGRRYQRYGAHMRPDDSASRMHAMKQQHNLRMQHQQIQQGGGGPGRLNLHIGNNGAGSAVSPLRQDSNRTASTFTTSSTMNSGGTSDFKPIEGKPSGAEGPSRQDSDRTTSTFSRQDSDKSYMSSIKMSSSDLSFVRGGLGEFLDQQRAQAGEKEGGGGRGEGVSSPPTAGFAGPQAVRKFVDRTDSERNSCRLSQVFKRGESSRSMMNEHSLSLTEIASEFQEKRRMSRIAAEAAATGVRPGNPIGRSITEGQEDLDSEEFSEVEELEGEPRPIALIEDDPDNLSFLGGSSMSIVKAALNESSESKFAESCGDSRAGSVVMGEASDEADYMSGSMGMSSMSSKGNSSKSLSSKGGSTGSSATGMRTGGTMKSCV